MRLGAVESSIDRMAFCLCGGLDWILAFARMTLRNQVHTPANLRAPYPTFTYLPITRAMVSGSVLCGNSVRKPPSGPIRKVSEPWSTI